MNENEIVVNTDSGKVEFTFTSSNGTRKTIAIGPGDFIFANTLTLYVIEKIDFQNNQFIARQQFPERSCDQELLSFEAAFDWIDCADKAKPTIDIHPGGYTVFTLPAMAEGVYGWIDRFVGHPGCYRACEFGPRERFHYKTAAQALAAWDQNDREAAAAERRCPQM